MGVVCKNIAHDIRTAVCFGFHDGGGAWDSWLARDKNVPVDSGCDVLCANLCDGVQPDCGSEI